MNIESEKKSICAYCKYGCTLNNPDQKETWCSNDKFELRQGPDNFPDMKSCDDYEIYKQAYQSQPMPDWYKDLYTDASGNCFSDADIGL